MNQEILRLKEELAESCSANNSMGTLLFTYEAEISGLRAQTREMKRAINLRASLAREIVRKLEKCIHTEAIDVLLDDIEHIAKPNNI